ncbi:hypothetical protein N500_0082 [Wolbachia pipientis wUni]|nr:hypothetical protein N500_0082 [Wolbachia pipientis wUni]
MGIESGQLSIDLDQEKVERKFGMFFTKRMMHQIVLECNS